VMGNGLITIEDVHKTYYLEDVEVKALRGVSLDIAAGEFISIMGPSGSGKSTLMHIIGCLDRPTSGSVSIEGRQTKKLNRNQLAKMRGEKIGFVFQSFNLLPRSNALKNVELPMIYAGIGLRERLKRAKEALRSVGLEERMYHRPSQLSGGQQQRVAIARALVNDPAILLADEPTGNLDSKSGAEVMVILNDLNSKGKTIILVTHEKYIAEHANRVVQLLDGNILSDERVNKNEPV
jgi:putative ABC transport system ATP-binding protein